MWRLWDAAQRATLTGMEPSRETSPDPDQPIACLAGGEIKRLYTDREAAARLGIARSTIWRLMETGALPYVRFLRNRRIEGSALEDFILTHRTVASLEAATPNWTRRKGER